MSQLREHWEGVSLPGDYLLQRWLSGDDAAGFFETTLPADGRPAVVKLVLESAVDGATQLALWQRTRSLHHPNLLELLDCGRAELAGEIVVFAVFEHADDTLASALAQGPLTEAEAREVLDAALEVLGYLQDRLLALPALDPDQVLAVGDTIKLSTDRLCETCPDTPYAAQLRALWNRISPSTPARTAEILAQALGEDPPAPPAPSQAETAPPAPQPPRPFPKWPLLGAAGVVLLILGLNLRTAPDTPAQPVSEAPAPIAAPADPKPAQPITATWRVIAFTAPNYEDAARMAEEVNQRHPDFQAAVFSPPEKKGYFLVSLGGPMSREDAVRLQAKARAESLAHDVYVKKFQD
jgi:hypothetical protein